MIKEAFKALAGNKKIDNLLTKLVNDPKFSLRFLILANTAKDAINCGFYVNQSLNNKDIPEEKRKFVAALDMANGILMIGAQLLLGFKFTSKEVQDKITKKLFGNLEKKATTFVNKSIISNPTNFTADLRIKLRNTAKLIPESCKKGFTAISTIIVTTVLAKRVIVPFIATPTASWLKKNYMDKKSPNDPNKTPLSKSVTVQNIVPPVLPQQGYQTIKQNTYPNSGVGSFENFNNFVQKGILFHN
jgi:hypothetical protein